MEKSRMALVQADAWQRTLFVGAWLGVACGALGGCRTVERARLQPSIVTDPELAAEAQHFDRKLSLEDRVAMDDEILEREDVLIHVIPGDLSAYETRGGASNLASSEFSKKYCKKHPLYHEIYGHIPWLFKHPKVRAKKEIIDFLENNARIIENRYRMQQMLEEVPEYMEPCFP